MALKTVSIRILVLCQMTLIDFDSLLVQGHDYGDLVNSSTSTPMESISILRNISSSTNTRLYAGYDKKLFLH